MSTEDEICVIGLSQKAEQQNQKIDYSEVARTRSGRRIRPPADVLLAKISSQTKTPTSRTKKSVILEHVEYAELNQASTECHTIVFEPTTIVSIESMQTEPCLDKPNIYGSSCSTIPAETVPPCLEKKENSVNLDSDAKQSHVVPLGKPKSGRIWKTRNKQRFSAMVRDKPLCSSWEKKMAAKQEKELLKKYSSGLRAERARKKEEKRKRHEENLKRRAENERKAEIVQVIRSTTKIKRMKKKQLRKIEKRDTLELLHKAHPQKDTGQKRS